MAIISSSSECRYLENIYSNLRDFFPSIKNLSTQNCYFYLFHCLISVQVGIGNCDIPLALVSIPEMLVQYSFVSIAKSV